MLNEERFQLKIGESRNNPDYGIFHLKIGIATDSDGNLITFEVSLNETYNAWYRNYERFNIHCSWDKSKPAYSEYHIVFPNQLLC